MVSDRCIFEGHETSGRFIRSPAIGEKGGQGLIMPTLISMRHHIATADGGNCTKYFQETMLKIIDRRFHNYFKFDETNKELLSAAVSTPKFKMYFIQDEHDFDTARRILTSECIQLLPEIDDNPRDKTISSNNLNNDDFF